MIIILSICLKKHLDFKIRQFEWYTSFFNETKKKNVYEKCFCEKNQAFKKKKNVCWQLLFYELLVGGLNRVKAKTTSVKKQTI